MKTIEERAANLAKEFATGKQNRETAVYRACIRMATEQRDIDAENACKWLSMELNQLAMDKLDEDFLRNNFKVILKEQVPEWVERFRKAMELYYN